MAARSLDADPSRPEPGGRRDRGTRQHACGHRGSVSYGGQTTVHRREALGVVVGRGGRFDPTSARAGSVVDAWSTPSWTADQRPPIPVTRPWGGGWARLYFASDESAEPGGSTSPMCVSVLWQISRAPSTFRCSRYWLGETPTRVWAMSRGCVIPGTPDIAFLHLELRKRDDRERRNWGGGPAPTKLRRAVIAGSRERCSSTTTRARSRSGTDPATRGSTLPVSSQLRRVPG